jgi:hypothetical protein
MRTGAIVFAALLCVVPTGPPKADQQSRAPGVAFGMALSSCGVYLQAAEAERLVRPPNASSADNAYAVVTPRFGMFVDFTDGFLSGANLGEPGATGPGRYTGLRSDHAGRMAWLENYCRSNPLVAFADAVIALHDFLAAQGR